jgi:DNA polymerase-3 subunit beta
VTATALEQATPVEVGPSLAATVQVADLVRAVRWTSWVIPRSVPLQVLLGLRLTCDRRGLRVSAFNYDTYAEETIAAPNAAGAALVPARPLLEVLRSIPTREAKDAQITLRVEQTRTGAGAVDFERLVLTCGAATFRLPLLQLEDYPTVPEDGTRLLSMPDADLSRLARVGVARGRVDTLPQLMCVLLERSPEGKVTAAATDRYRLAVQALDVDAPADMPPLLVPGQVLERAARELGRDASDVALYVADTGEPHERRVTLRAGSRALGTRCDGGAFPKYQQLIPTEFAGTGTVDRQLLLEGAQQGAAAALIESRYAPVVHLTWQDQQITFASGGAPDESDRASASATVPAVITGKPLSTAYNPTYLLAGVNSLPAGPVTLSQQGAARPVTLSSPEAPGYTYLLMPVRLSG